MSSQYNFGASEVENAFSHVAAIAGGPLLSKAISLTLLIATIGSGMGSQLGAARLLYGMGRSGAIPKGFFGAIHPKTRIPANNVAFVGAIALIGAFLITYDNGAELLNFGALIAFMGVNLASLTHYYIRGKERTAGAVDSASAGIRHLLVHLDTSVEAGDDRGFHLDDCWHRLRSVEDPGFPEPPGEFRRTVRKSDATRLAPHSSR